ncbi:MAG: SUMF1/EgtB/PvdO family nonheme iron enzyme [bacterium]|nr:SUMF1/EgtB/PvdO family nonheme iron enzyme [bacterium]
MLICLLLILALTSLTNSACAQGDRSEIPERYDLARMSLQDGKTDYAEQQFLKILKLDPKHAPSHLSLGHLYHRQKRIASAYRHFKTYLDLSPATHTPVKIQTLLNTLADSLKASGKSWVVNDPSRPWGPASVPEPDELGFLAIQGGTFLMGGTFKNETPVRLISVADFELMDHEVTNVDFFSFTKATGHPSLEHWREDWFWMSQFGTHPAVNITWHDADTYCRWLDARLPTEAEWEYACRAGRTQAKYPWGDTSPDETKANFGRILKTPYPTKPVKSYAPNAYNLYDMAGNVWEWCADWYDPDYYKKGPTDNPKGPDKGFDFQHTRRGGQWQSSPHSLRCARRYGDEPSAQDNGSMAYFGFRCAR